MKADEFKRRRLITRTLYLLACWLVLWMFGITLYELHHEQPYIVVGILAAAAIYAIDKWRTK